MTSTTPRIGAMPERDAVLHFWAAVNEYEGVVVALAEWIDKYKEHE